MKNFIYCIILSHSVTALATEVKYFYGKVNFYHPNEVYEKSTDSLVKRTIDHKLEKIEEVITQPSQSSGEKPSEMVTLISKISEDLFQVEDLTNNSFTGTMSFIKKYDQWTYNLKVADGTLTGDGYISKDGAIITKKMLKIPQYKYERIIKEELKSISKKQYLKIRKEILTN